MAIEIVRFPIENMCFSTSVLAYQRVSAVKYPTELDSFLMALDTGERDFGQNDKGSEIE